jgi:glutamate/tyrosine decarboxylase-like PLP-dependent enzyme
MVERHCAVARLIADQLRSENAIAVLNDVVLNQVLVRFGADEPAERGDELTRATIARIQSDGAVFAGGAKWRGRDVMRISVISWLIDEAAGKAAAEAIVAGWRAVQRGS